MIGSANQNEGGKGRRKSVAAEAVVQDGTRTAYWERLSYADQDEVPLGQGEEPQRDNSEGWTTVKAGDRRSSGTAGSTGGGVAGGSSSRSATSGLRSSEASGVAGAARSTNLGQNLPPLKQNAWQHPPSAIKEAPSDLIDAAAARGLKPHAEAPPPAPERKIFGEEPLEDEARDYRDETNEADDEVGRYDDQDGAQQSPDSSTIAAAGSSRHPNHSSSLTAPRATVGSARGGAQTHGNEKEGWGSWIKRTIFGA